MRNTILTILFILLLGNLSHAGLPWWCLAPIAAVSAFLFPLRAAGSLHAGFWGGFLLWLLNALWLDQANAGLLSAKIGLIFLGLSNEVLLLITGVLGGAVAALGVLTGKFARDLYVSRKQIPA